METKDNLKCMVQPDLSISSLDMVIRKQLGGHSFRYIVQVDY